MNKIRILFLLVLSISILSCNALNFDNFDKLDTKLKEYKVKNDEELEEILNKPESNIKIVLQRGIYTIHRVLLYDVRNLIIEGESPDNTLITLNFEIKNSENIGFRNLKIRYRGAGLHQYIFRVKNTKNLLMENVIIEKARTNAIELIESKIKLSGCTIRYNEGSGILGTRNSDICLNETQVHNNQNYGIAIVNSLLKTKNTKVSSNYKDNIVFERGSKGIIIYSTINKSIQEGGVRIRKSHVNLYNTNLMYNKTNGITYLNNGESVINNCFISFNENIGINANDSNLQIENTLFEENNIEGLHLVNSDAILRSTKVVSTIEGGGVYAEDTSLNLVKCVFHHNKKSGVTYINSKGTILSTLSSYSILNNGLFLDNSVININLSNFKYNNEDGIKFINNTKGTIKNTKMTLNNSDGLDVSTSEVIVKRCTFNSNIDYGLKADKSVVTIEEASIEENGKGSISNEDSNIKQK